MLLRSLTALLALGGVLASASVADSWNAREVEYTEDEALQLMKKMEDLLHVQDGQGFEDETLYYSNMKEDDTDSGDDHSAQPPTPETSDKTIFQVLAEEPKYHKAFKFVNFTEDVAKLLNDSSANVTFFVPPNWALKPPGHRRPGAPRHAAVFHYENWEDDVAPISDKFGNTELDLFEAAETLFTYVQASEDNDDKEKRKQILKAIIKAILSYHIIPSGNLPAAELLKNSTYATGLTLHDGSLDGKAFRVLVSSVPRIFPLTFSVNVYAKVVKHDIPASNGVLHEINHPLIPPGSTFQSAFLLEQFFSTATSALQRVGLTDEVEWRYVHGSDGEKGAVEGSSAVTFFAPSNSAFKRLPPRLRTFLFSPFGERVLKKLLQYHIVPNAIIHTDFFHNASDSEVTQKQTIDPICTCFDHPNLHIIQEGIADLSHIDLNLARERRRHGHHVDWMADERRHEGLRHTMCNLMEAIPPCHAGHVEHDLCGQLGWGFSERKRLDESCKCRGVNMLPHHPFPQSPSPNHRGDRRSPPDHRGEHPPPTGHCGEHHPPPPPPMRHAAPVYELNLTVPTLLTNHSLHIHVVQHEHKLPIPGHHTTYSKALIVNGHPVRLADIPTRNGAVHVIDRLLNPIKKQHPKHGEEGETPMILEEEDLWEDWEEWLPLWAAED
ncbi:hypothetical protein CERSUDRAFT_94231 [Gelatoporia subvermispora B]|uniref:FAS1 domain-containing protein n=1 Tax=Ceriporiopsis subvermispora (strain B) TaxID=914234 RepID=M2PQ74_CERS8|nr:hypothetical protein CERSUDRAFT_94231 [Gelatoporia subvermispora B]